MVADGMGGHKGGDKASKIAIEEASQAYQSQIQEGMSKEAALENAITIAAQKVFLVGKANPDLKGMGTTLSALAINHDRAFLAHIGDTRIYCLRDKTLHQLTSDHSLVNEQVQAGIMTQEEARVSSLKNIITRAIGHDEYVKPDYFSILLKQNDIFMLCTDGLNNMLCDHEIAEIILKLEPSKAIKRLILEANRKGGEDNISVILVKVKF